MLNVRPILQFGARVGSFRRKLVFQCATTEAHPSIATAPVAFRFGTRPISDALASPEYSYDTAARAFGLERLRAGDRLVICESAGRIVFYAWVMFGQMDMGIREFAPLPSDCAYTYKLFTIPDFRGRRVCPAYYTFIRRELRGLGYRRLFAWMSRQSLLDSRTHPRRLLPRRLHLAVRLLFRSYPILRGN